MREEFHAEGGRDFFFYGAKADRQVELRVELLCLREDFIDPDRVKFLHAVVEEDADPHEDRRERREAYSFRSESFGSVAGMSTQKHSMSPWTARHTAVIL